MKKVLLVLLVLGMVGIVNAATVTDDFNSYADGTGLNDTGIWYTSGTLQVDHGTGKGVGDTPGVSSHNDGAALSAGIYKDSALTHVKWTQLSVGDYVTISADYETSSDATQYFDDDRLGMITDHDSSSSGRILGAQLDKDSQYASGIELETYFDGVGANDKRVHLAEVPNVILTSAWYNLSVTITKLGDFQAQFDVILSELDGTLIAQGSLDTGDLPADDQPHHKYFLDNDLSSSDTNPPINGGGLWPYFKNNGNSSSGLDNFSYTMVPEPMTLSLLGFGGLALLRRRRA